MNRVKALFSDRLSIILQTEAAECGLACLGMIANFYGFRCDMIYLRTRFAVTLKGLRLTNLIEMAGSLNIATRAVTLETDDIFRLRLPCIIHYKFNHFVVLSKIGRRGATVFDPALGVRHVNIKEFSLNFSGVALECWPRQEFQPQDRNTKISWRQLVGPVVGLRQALAQVAVFALALEFLTIVAPFYLQGVIDDGLVSGDRELIGTLAIGFGFILLLQKFVSFMRSWVLMYISAQFNLQWTANVFSHLLRLPLSYFEKRHLADVSSRFAALSEMQKILTGTYIESLLDGIMSTAAFILMVAYSLKLSLIVVGCSAVYAAGRAITYRTLRDIAEESVVHSANQHGHFLETLRGIKAIKVFAKENQREAIWTSLFVDKINADLKVEKYAAAFKAFNGILYGIENIIVVWIGSGMVLNGNFSVGLLTAFLAYKLQFDNRMASLIDKMGEFSMLALQGQRVADIVLHPSEDCQASFGDSGESLSRAVFELKNIRFRYGDSEPEIICGLNLIIQKGESIAIIGESGSGKSTLVNILLGLLSATSGDLYFEGRLLHVNRLPELRKKVGTVLQDDTLFAGTIADNICFFDPVPDRQKMEMVAKLAFIFVDIVAMPMGFDTHVGDMGSVLSGGQRQRILLARALYKQPSVLILDEATSALDVSNEHQVNRSIKSLEITRVIVAHRPETIRSADRILLIRDGCVAYDGPPSEKALEGILANRDLVLS